MGKSNEELINEAKTSSLVLEKLFNQNINLIYSLMNRFYYSKEEKEDLFSCAKCGFIKAVYSFDESYNCMFSTYAVPLILGEIKKYFRDSVTLHISRSVKDLYRQINQAMEILENEKSRSVSLNEIAEYLHVSYEDILFAFEAHRSLINLDQKLNQDDDSCLLDIISSNENNLDNYALNLALEQLDKKEKLIIDLRYFQGYSQQEVAERLFLSQVQISRLEKKILEKLKVLI